MTIRFPGESSEYRTARDRLLEQEIELRRATEKVAALRRALPPGGVVPEDDVFQAPAADGAFHRDRDAIRHFSASELFDAPTEPGEDPRHVGTLEPLWNLLDLTPEGRPADWYEQLSSP